MAVTIEDLYRCYGVLADAKDLSQVGEAPWLCWVTLWEWDVVCLTRGLVFPPRF